MARFCTACGAALPADAVFCGRCGARIGDSAPSADRTAQPRFRPTAGPAVSKAEALTATGAVPAAPTVLAAAPASPASRAYAFGPTGWIRGTVSTLFSGLFSLIGGFFKVFTKPKALLFTAAISALWIWLNHLRLLDSLNGAFEVLAKVTYSRGGTGGTLLQIIGGTIGKGIVGAALCTILYSGIGKAVRGIGNIFSEPGFNLGAALLGFGFAGIAYTFTAGFAGADGIPVGIAGSALSLEGLASRDGFLVNLAASFSAKRVKSGGTTGKRLLPGRYKGFLTGSAIGFVVWMLLTVSEKTEELASGAGELVTLDLPDGLTAYLIPAALVLVGMILNTIGKGKGADNA